MSLSLFTSETRAFERVSALSEYAVLVANPAIPGRTALAQVLVPADHLGDPSDLRDVKKLGTCNQVKNRRKFSLLASGIAPQAKACEQDVNN